MNFLKKMARKKISEPLLEELGFVKEQMGVVTSQFRYPKMYGNDSYIINENIIGQWVFRIYDDKKKIEMSICVITFKQELMQLWLLLTKEKLQ